MEKICIIIPAHNEEKRIGETLRAYCRFFSELKKKKILDFEISVILNGCVDNTLGVVKAQQKSCKELIFLDFVKGGKGFALIEGFKDALTRKNDLIGFVDADMATSAQAFFDLVKNIGGYAGVIASRGMKNSEVQTSFKRKLTNRGFNFFVRSLLFLPYHDTQCGAKVFRKKAIESIVGELNVISQWAIDVDLLYRLKLKGFKIKEIPTIWEDKKDSKIHIIKTTIQMVSAVIRLRIVHSPLNFIVRAYEKLPDKMKIHNW